MLCNFLSYYALHKVVANMLKYNYEMYNQKGGKYMKKIGREYLLITVGIVMVAYAMEYFFIPNNIAAGGVTGLAIIINYYLPLLSVEIYSFAFNVILFIIGFIFIGGNFGVKTVYSALGLSGSMWLIKVIFNPVAITKDLMLASIFGTLVSALGMAIVFNQNASTGGTDIIAKILNKFFHVDIGKSLLLVDFIVIFLSGITFGWDVGMYALLSILLNGFTIDRAIEGFNVCKQVMIISSKNNEISKFIMDELERGCTIFNGKGAYTGNDTYVLYSVINRKEFIKLKYFIKEVDPDAFISVNEVHEVLGEGFKKIE